MAVVQHNENYCELLRLLGHDDLRQLLLHPGRWGLVGLWRGGQYPVPGFIGHSDFNGEIVYKIQPNQFYTVLL
jgi:hypothetical protein